MSSEFLTLMERGGPIMWVIFATACVAFAMLVWQALVVFNMRRGAQRDYQQLQRDHAYVPERNARRSPLGQLLLLVNWPDVQSKEDLTRELNMHSAEVVSKMQGWLPTIATLGTLLPMLGLLGTVTGMINVFEVIALHGSGKPDEMAEGISQALLTTASGLIIAIPVIFLHHLLSSRVEALMTLTGQAVQIILHRDMEYYRPGTEA